MPTWTCVARRLRFCVIAMLLIRSVAEADEVHVRTLQGGVRVQRGVVEDFRGAALTLRTAGGQTMEIPAAQVEKIEADWSPAHRQADALAAEHDFAAAMRSYATAFQEEQRTWVKRRLLADVVRCQHCLGNAYEAGKNFRRLLTDDPETPYFAAIPLLWQARPPQDRATTLAKQWLDGNEPSALRLLAASWLLPTDARSTAKDVLQRLARGPDRRLALLATTQLWRTQLVTVLPDRLTEWDRQIQELPQELRGGPYFLLGRAHARANATNDALLAWLRLPTQYPEQPTLAQAALVESARLLEKQEARGQAIRLYREAVSLGPTTNRGREAASRLAALGQ